MGGFQTYGLLIIYSTRKIVLTYNRNASVYFNSTHDLLAYNRYSERLIFFNFLVSIGRVNSKNDEDNPLLFSTQSVLHPPMVMKSYGN
jgi:hypothetical protein